NYASRATIYDPTTTDATGKRRPFQENVISANRLDPAAIAFLQKLPLPNLPGEVQNYLATPSFRNDNDQGAARLDHHLTHSDSLFSRFYAGNFDAFQPFGSSLLN